MSGEKLNESIFYREENYVPSTPSDRWARSKSGKTKEPGSRPRGHDEDGSRKREAEERRGTSDGDTLS